MVHFSSQPIALATLLALPTHICSMDRPAYKDVPLPPQETELRRSHPRQRNASVIDEPTPRMESRSSQDNEQFVVKEFGKETKKVSDIPSGISLPILELIALAKSTNSETPRVGSQKDELPLGCILYGPSGTGKTTIAEIFAYETGWPLTYIPVHKLITKPHIFKEQTLHALFADVMLKKAKIILLFDEFDKIDQPDSVQVAAEIDKMAQAIMKYMGKNRAVFFIFATSNFAQLPEVIRKSVPAYELILPTESQCFAIFNALHASYLQAGYRFKIHNTFFSDLAVEAVVEKQSHRDCETLFKKAHSYAIARNEKPDWIEVPDFYQALYAAHKEKTVGFEGRLWLIRFFLWKKKPTNYPQFPEACAKRFFNRNAQDELFILETTEENRDFLVLTARMQQNNTVKPDWIERCAQICTEAMRKESPIFKEFAKAMDGWSVERIEHFIDLALGFSFPYPCNKNFLSLAYNHLQNDDVIVSENFAFLLCFFLMLKNRNIPDDWHKNGFPFAEVIQGLTANKVREWAEKTHAWAARRSFDKDELLAEDGLCAFYEITKIAVVLNIPVINYFLKHHWVNNCTPHAVAISIDCMQGMNLLTISLILDAAARFALTRGAKAFQDEDLYISCYCERIKQKREIILNQASDYADFVGIIFSYLLESKKHKLSVDDIEKIVSAIMSPTSLRISTKDLREFIEKAQVQAEMMKGKNAPISLKDFVAVSQSTSSTVPNMRDLGCVAQ